MVARQRLAAHGPLRGDRPIPMRFEQAIERGPGFVRHLERDAQPFAHLLAIQQVHQRERPRRVELVAQPYADRVLAQRAGELGEAAVDAVGTSHAVLRASNSAIVSSPVCRTSCSSFNRQPRVARTTSASRLA